MFSEYASRFLAQSQSRISNFAQPDNADTPPRNPNDRFRQSTQPLRSTSRGFPQRLGNPYQTASQLSGFNFAAPAAPLFHSALDEFREEDDEEEREREVADYYALQRSRRVARLEESEETEHAGGQTQTDEVKEDDDRPLEGRGRVRGIKSSWNGGLTGTRERGMAPETVDEETDGLSRVRSQGSSKGKERMVDIGLESTIGDSEPPDDLVNEPLLDDSPPAFQKFRSAPKTGPIRLPTESRDGDMVLNLGATIPRPPSSVETVPATIATTLGEAPSHDIFWGSLYLICLGSLFATFFLVFLHTSPGKNLGDTIYTTLHASFYLFAVDTVASIIVSLVWLALLRSFVRNLVHLIVLAVPVILFSFSLYPFVSSYKGEAGGKSIQDQAMRWLSFIPGIFAALWLYTIFKGRHVLNKAIGILEFASRILAANPALLGLGLATLGAVVVWTWMWLGMFTRVFLAGHIGKTSFIIEGSTWWLGVYFVLIYIWTLSVINGIQRSTTAATVSQWYFHRNATPSLASRDVVAAALQHSTSTLFGTVCLSTLITLMIRLPLLLLPKQIVGLTSLFAYSLIPTPITELTNPLTLTYAAIHSQSLQTSARGFNQMTFLGPQAAPAATLTPRHFNARNSGKSAPILPYRLAKLLLHGTRFIMSIGLGFGGWVATARQLAIAVPGGAGIRGSAYAYVVGIVAGFIGWGVLGAMEGVLSGIVDASVICWGSERGMAGGGAYCLEAGYLFGEERRRGEA
ncbi:hypothetical protein BJ875DRAFT_497409 [Amylocarpus encephaloides]|uniref:Protein PNS1 n=1 Tax=Amylocarpus encephaloides TaxID=45428 RepID=A0A9P7YFK1_9HELO|nr:hypothetical protein BJ875DRAFT_497409 [Amylocarpus encephaloides]